MTFYEKPKIEKYIRFKVVMHDAKTFHLFNNSK